MLTNRGQTVERPVEPKFGTVHGTAGGAVRGTAGGTAVEFELFFVFCAVLPVRSFLRRPVVFILVPGM